MSLKRKSVLGELRENQEIMLAAIGTEPALSTREIVGRALMLTISSAKPREKLVAFSFFVQFGSHGESIAHLNERLDLPKVLPAKGQEHLTSEDLEHLYRETSVQAANNWWASVEGHREWFRNAVESIILNVKAARRRLQPDISAGLKQVVPIPRMSWNGRESITDIYYRCDDIDGVFGYSLMLMLDVNGEIGRALKECKLVQCDRLFLSFPPVGGGPRPDYCDPEHKLIADRLTGAERTARWREKKRRQSKKKRARARK